MAKCKIVGLKETTYTNKKTGELVERIEIHHAHESKDCIGQLTGFDTITRNAFPEQFETLINLKEKALGKSVFISKDVRTFNGSSYSIVDDFEIL